MQVQLKKIKICHNLSEESTAYTADLYINGHKAAAAKNDGHGGCDLYQPYDAKGRDLVREAEAHFSQTTASLSDGTTFPGNLETEVARLLDEHETKQNLRRELRKGIVCLEKGEILLYQFRCSQPKPGTPEWRAAVQKILAKHPGSVVLNDLPIDEAVEKIQALPA